MTFTFLCILRHFQDSRVWFKEDLTVVSDTSNDQVDVLSLACFDPIDNQLNKNMVTIERWQQYAHVSSLTAYLIVTSFCTLLHIDKAL